MSVNNRNRENMVDDSKALVYDLDKTVEFQNNIIVTIEDSVW